MAFKVFTYEGGAMTVHYESKRCIHAQECVHGLPGVFDPEKRPWVAPDAASADEIAEVIRRCPTGALYYERKDGGAEEEAPEENTVTMGIDGPLYLHGRVQVRNAAGETVFEGLRVALCRCGDSKAKPFCDGTHVEAGFEASADIVAPMIRQGEPSSPELVVTVRPDGPLIAEGPVVVREGGGGEHRGTNCALCRCGASDAKPFCDGSHKSAGFVAE